MNNKIIKLLSCLIPNKEKRRNFRNRFQTNVSNRNNILLNGSGNKIIIDDKIIFQNTYLDKIKLGNIIINGNNNTLKLKNIDNICMDSYLICNGNNTTLEIDSPKLLKLKLNYYCDIQGERKVIIKENCIINGLEVHMDEGRYLEIGKNCLMSYNICFWLTDGHTIIFEDSTINDHYDNRFIIGDHTWIGYGVTILPNSSGLPKNCVVGANSVVCKRFDKNNILVAGNPAKIIKRNIKWDIENPHIYNMRRS